MIKQKKKKKTKNKKQKQKQQSTVNSQHVNATNTTTIFYWHHLLAKILEKKSLLAIVFCPVSSLLAIVFCPVSSLCVLSKVFIHS